jgi:drug/metabolite transporter (DMT)-like permease
MSPSAQLVVGILIAQILFTTGDILARSNLSKTGFHLSSFLHLWFVAYVLLRTVATGIQLWVLSHVQIGRVMGLFGATSIVISSLIGVLWLKEIISLTSYVGISLAVIAIFIIALTR